MTWAPATLCLIAKVVNSIMGNRSPIISFYLAFMRLQLEYGIQFWPQGKTHKIRHNKSRNLEVVTQVCDETLVDHGLRRGDFGYLRVFCTFEKR